MKGPRYRVARVPFSSSDVATCGPQDVTKLELDGDERIVSVYPVSYQLPPHGAGPMPSTLHVVLEALIERVEPVQHHHHSTEHHFHPTVVIDDRDPGA